jgi:hypothetical protein
MTEVYEAMQGCVVTLLLMSGVDARTVRRSSILRVLYVDACAFFVRHLKCIKVISFQVSVPVQMYVSSQKQILQ